MTLSLTITNVEKLDNGESLTLPLERIGALIGRSPTVDWSLPDPRNHISGTHCEVVYQDGEYLLFDRSTNGTFINGDTARLEGPHKLVAGDKITIGHYEIAASFGDEAPRAPPPPPSGWDTPPGVPPAPPPPPWPEPIPARPQRSSGWEPPPPRAPPNWSPPVPPPPRPPVGWEPPSAPPTPPPPPAWNDTRSKADAAWPPSPLSPRDGSGWGPTPPPPGQDGWPPPPPMVGTGEATDDPWSRSGGAMSGRGLGGSHSWAPPGIARSPPPTAGVWQHLEDIHDVDWVGAGFERSNAAAAPPPRPPDPAQGAWPAFLEAAGVKEASLTVTPQEAATTAGGLLRRLVAGLIVMLEARARAKSELRATGTEFRFDGNNPLKFHKDPESALIQLLNRKERSFMAPDLAAEEAFRDLQAHQIATLAAMQQALRATLDRFSPTAIRDRSRPHGLFANLLGVARDAQLWRAYEHDFEGVAQGSDEAFMDVFAKQFREAYEHAAAEMKRKR